MARPTIEALRTAYQGWSQVFVATVAMPDGTRLSREIEDHGSAAVVLPYDPDRRVALMVRQLRAPALHVDGVADLLEAPAGLLDDDDPETCARREAEEEVGLTLRALEPIGAIYAMPGISTEKLHLFFAPYSEADRTGAGGGVSTETESIVVEERSLAELAALADAGELLDMKTMLLVQTLRLRRPDLFT